VTSPPVISPQSKKQELAMSKLFEPFKINKLEIKNRFVRSATVDNLGRDKMVSDAQLAFYREMVLGEIGLIISSGLFPSMDGWTAPGQLGIHHDDGIADAVSMCRPVIMDQHIVRKFRRAMAEASKCTSCNGCIEWMQKQDIHCVFNKKLIQD
jgi:2,4-dienoyl-CoA reductase-like NADH-dependent reductase (Old Yellow Enzyme family)